MYFLIYLLSVCAVSVLFCVIAIKKNAPCFAGLSKKEHPLRFFYPAGYVLYILERTGRRKKRSFGHYIQTEM